MGKPHDRNEQLLWKSALILTIAGLIVKILSALYRIPFQNIAGDIGFYIYQQVYPFYGIALILSTYGFPVIISKLVAEQNEANSSESKRVVRTAVGVLFIVFSAIFFSLFLGAEKIANIMGDHELSLPLKVVSFSFLFVPFLSTLRGYFQGQNYMTPTAVSQVGEQSVRVATILILSYLLFTSGSSSYVGAAGAISGSITGGICSVIILSYFWLKKKTVKTRKVSTRKTTLKTTTIMKEILGQGLTICVSSLFLVLLQLVDAFTLFSQLVASGNFSLIEAKVEKGIFDRGQPLIQLGTVVATSLSLTLVPLISAALARHDHLFIKEKVQLSLRVSFVVGIGATLGLIGIIRPTNVMLFKTIDGSNVLAILAITILFSSLTMTAAAIIQGLGDSVSPAVFVGVGVGCKIILNLLLVPTFATSGAAVATVVAFLVTTGLTLRLLARKLRSNLLVGREVARVLFAGICMIVFLYIYENALNGILHIDVTNRMVATLQALSGVILGGALFLLIIIRMNIFSQQELETLPFGSHLVRFMKMETQKSRMNGWR